MSDENALAKGMDQSVKKAGAIADQIVLVSGETIERNDAMLLTAMFMSGYFKDIDSLTKAVVRVTFGQKIGVDVATAVTSLYIIDGKPALEAQAIRNTAVAAGYTINTLKLDDEECILEWEYKGKHLGKSSYSKVDAQRIGFVDETCDWPTSHNIRKIRKYIKYERRWAEVDGCECKDNWKSTPQDMLMARATTKGNRMYGNKAFKQEVYDIDELRDSNIRPDTTATDVARDRIAKAKDMDELEAITKDLTPEEMVDVMDNFKAKTRELLDEQKNTDTTSDGGPSTPEK